VPSALIRASTTASMPKSRFGADQPWTLRWSLEKGARRGPRRFNLPRPDSLIIKSRRPGPGPSSRAKHSVGEMHRCINLGRQGLGRYRGMTDSGAAKLSASAEGLEDEGWKGLRRYPAPTTKSSLMTLDS